MDGIKETRQGEVKRCREVRVGCRRSERDGEEWIRG